MLVVLLFAGHTSNFSYDIEQLAKNNGIIITQFPSNSTHLLQPLEIFIESLIYPWHKSTAPGTIKKSFQIPGVYSTNKKKLNLYFKGNDKEILSSIFGSKESESIRPSHSSQTALSIFYSRYQEDSSF